MIGPVLLGDLIRDGKLLWLYCRECFRERDVDPSTIPLPPDGACAGDRQAHEVFGVRIKEDR
jgi:hypothetical protein